MALGIPVVCSAVGGSREAVRHEESGFLVTDTEAWAAALVRLTDSPDLRRRMGLAGRRIVEERYSAAASAARFAETLRAVTRHTGAATTTRQRVFTK